MSDADSHDGGSLFVGRTAELAALTTALAHATEGRGRVTMLVGEAGIGKTRTAAEFAAHARATGALVLRGGCYEGEWAPPYGPFVEALTAYVRAADPAQLRDELGFGAAPLARLLPAIRERIPDLPEPVALQLDEERARLFDAASQFLIAIAARQPLVLLLDDLHWADRGTMLLLRHVARVTPQHRLLLIGAFRDVEVAVHHPLAEVLGHLRRESNYERILLTGLSDGDTAELITELATGTVAPPVITGIITHAEGNPFFVREMVQHLREEDALGDAQLSFPDLTLPDGIQHLIGCRLTRLSSEANRLLTVASAFAGPFHFGIAAAVASLGQDTALSTIDEGLQAYVIQSTVHADRYEFTHALIRHAIYRELNPSRRVRLHRQLAESMAQMLTVEHAGEIAHQYYCSRDLPGAERGASFALVAADRAVLGYAHAEVARALRVALALLPANAPDGPQVHARLGLALVGALRFEEAVSEALEAAARTAETTSPAAAADYFAEVARALDGGGGGGLIPALARKGLLYAGDRRDATWAELKIYEIVERDNNSANGIPVDTPERQEVARVLERTADPSREMSGGSVTTFVSHFRRLTSREEILSRDPYAACVFEVGDYRGGIQLMRDLLQREKARIALQVGWWAGTSCFHVALGEFDHARDALRMAVALAARLPEPAAQVRAGVDARSEGSRDQGINWKSNPEPRTVNWEPGTVNPGPGTRDSEPNTRNQRPACSVAKAMSGRSPSRQYPAREGHAWSALPRPALRPSAARVSRQRARLSGGGARVIGTARISGAADSGGLG